MIEALPAAGSAAARTLNVAIVDDDESVRRALSTLLRAAGINVSRRQDITESWMCTKCQADMRARKRQ